MTYELNEARSVYSIKEGAFPPPPPPVNTALPAISGERYVGGQLSVTNGSWTYSPTGYAYQWRRGGANIAGANGSTYLLVPADAGAQIDCVVTATNISGSTQAAAAAVGPIDAYAIFADFKAQAYRRHGAALAGLSSFPGYSFSRTGTQGAIDASGAVQWFGPNVPAINSAGYHCFNALTNLLLRSQEFEQSPWANMGVTLTPNAIAAPDGTMTADRVVLSTATNLKRVDQTITVVAGTTYTESFFVNADQVTQITCRGMGNTERVVFDLVAKTATITGTFYSAAGVRDLGNGWLRCWMIFTATGTSYVAYYGFGTGNTTGNGTDGFYLWQAQVVAGNFRDGSAPLIATAGAAATIGASVLEIGAALPNGDFIAWTAQNNPPPATSQGGGFAYSTAGAGTTNERAACCVTSGHLEFEPRAAGAAQPGPSLLTNIVGATGGRVVPQIGRRNSKYLSAAKSTAGAITIRDDASGTGAAANVNALDIGCQMNGTGQVNGTVEFFGQRNGTFSDVDITAILQAA